ncbi:LysR substrate-binding domain-containing protein [Phenylobacterium sp.]|uniref:LysR substrate-binding domain-containing protein n=1 Tax=Phenylobacterium sp. TaxID=1871053 RepID=UPI003BABABE8
MRRMHELGSPVWGRSTPPLAALRAFDAAVRLGSFRAAAESLGLTPSAVSHQIGALERALGATLFHRQGRAMVLSEAGEALAPFVRQGFLAFERGAYAVRGGARARQIRVSALAMFSQLVLIPNLGQFAKRWPAYDVRIESSPRFVDFDQDDFDVGVRVGDGRWPGLKCTELLRITGAPVANLEVIQRLSLRDPRDLVGTRLIHDTAQPHAWRTWLKANGVDRPDEEGDLWLDSAPATLHAADQGLGVAFAIDPLVRAWPGFGERLVFALPGFSGPATRYWVVRRPESERDPKIRAFITWLRAACRDLG